MQCFKRAQILFLLCLVLGASGAYADPVEIRLSPGVIGTADYRTGKPGLPAVLLLHGFLQTRNAPPMSRLAGALSDAGYPVLAPTLSLGVSRRNKSLPCEAVHTHTQQDELHEIAQWVNWLAEHKHQKIIMIGHSSGAKDVLAYLTGAPSALVERAILVAITPIEVDAEQHRKARAEKAPAPGVAPPLQRFSTAYCKNNYATTPAAYLSYADWTADFILVQLGKIRIPADIIFGTNDRIVPPNWLARLKKSGVPVVVIENAGHFFDDEYEFDLNDRVLELLKKKAR